MLADLDLMMEIFKKYIAFHPEIHRKKKLPIEPKDTPNTICFTYLGPPNRLEKTSQAQCFHVFDSRGPDGTLNRSTQVFSPVSITQN